MIDSSIALGWFLPDENSSLADQVLIEVTESGALVPRLFSVEFGNVLLMAVRRGRIDRDYRGRAFERIAQLDLVTDHDGGEQFCTDAVEVADAHGLTLYDAVYLELALRTGMRLATLDRRLAEAAHDRGVLWS